MTDYYILILSILEKVDFETISKEELAEVLSAAVREEVVLEFESFIKHYKGE